MSTIETYNDNCYLKTEPDESSKIIKLEPFRRAQFSGPCKSIMIEGFPVLTNNGQILRRGCNSIYTNDIKNDHNQITINRISTSQPTK